LGNIQLRTYPYLKMPYAIIKGEKRRLTEQYINAVKELGLAMMEFHREHFGELYTHGQITIYDMKRTDQYLHCTFYEGPKSDYLAIRPGGAAVEVDWAENRHPIRPVRLRARRRRKPVAVFCSDKKYPISGRFICAVKELLLSQIELYRKLNIGRYRYGFAEIIDLGWSDFGTFLLSNKRNIRPYFDPENEMIKVKFSGKSRT
jgi:hypothetical protein